MNTTHLVGRTSVLLALCALALLPPSSTIAHCDGMDGPVVQAAQKALTSGNVELVLIWVQRADESEIRKAFDHTMAVRRLGPEAQELADTYFFETLVRVHRAGEGAPFTGLEPAGRDLGPAIPLADQALITQKVDPLVELITEEMRRGVIQRFQRAAKARSQLGTDVEAGRDYVRAYVEFIHYAERAHEAASQEALGHFPDSHAAEAHGE